MPSPSRSAPLLAVLLILPLTPFPAAADEVDSAAGLVVVAAERWEGGEWLLSTPVTVAPGAVLRIENATLLAMGLEFTIEAGGTVILEGSRLTSAPDATPVPWTVHGRLHIEDTLVERTAGFRVQYPTARFEAERLTYRENSGSIFLSRGAFLSVQDSLFERNRLTPVDINDSHADVARCRFLENGGLAAIAFFSTTATSHAFGEVEGRVVGSLLRGSSRGLHFQGADADRIRIEGNLFEENTLAIGLQASSNPTFRGNHLRNNTVAYYNYGRASTADLSEAPWVADARGNYWGPEGPATSGRNWVGGREPVLVAPWLIEDPVPHLSASP